MKSTLIVAGLIGFASAGGFALAAPASATCAPGFTSIPCTIADNVSQAPATAIGSLAASPGVLASSVAGLPGQFVEGAQTPQNLAGVNCPANSPQDTCGLAGAPGQFFGPGGGLEQIATAPQTIAGNLLAAPGVLANSLTHGGKYTPDSTPPSGGSNNGGSTGGTTGGTGSTP